MTSTPAPPPAGAPVPDVPDEVLLPAEAAAVLRVPLATMTAWRHRRRVDGTRAGPAFIRIEGNRVRYLRKDLHAYLEAQRYANRGHRSV
jgi:hypothetical protein